jgi:tetratricopeptide (TPR) repeat protein
MASDNTEMDDLALVDTTRHQIPGEETETAATTQASAVTTGIASATQITPHATTRMDSTSTETYAPDNYDRTLMKLPSDDASKIFAGMKSDADVVMTPDYAKKVFRSKSSAQRMHAYKVYSGMVVVILLTIGIYGAFEFQDRTDNIDSSLRPLKRDPMPGIIKLKDINQQSSFIAESGTKARTIEIIESADSAGEIMAVDEGVMTDEGVVADEGVIAEEALATDDVAVVEKTIEADNSAVIAESAAPAQAEPVATTQVASVIQAEVAAADSASNSSTLEIISSSRIEQKDLWLREAYNAYKSGDSSRAMTLYNQVLEIDPSNRNALLARAAIYVQNNNSNAAIKDYQTLLLRNPKDSLAMTSLITVANLSPQETESQLKLMIRDEPDSPHLNFALANAYGVQNRWQEAQGYYFKALENNPGDPNYAYNLAVSLEHIAQPLAAVSYYRRALNNINNNLATFNQEIVNQRVEILTKQ